jgi:AraC-like DNA-binding protein
MSMSDCPYCNQIHQVGGMFCSRKDSFENLQKLNSGIHILKSSNIETPDPHLTRLSMNFDLHGGLSFEVKGRKYELVKKRFLLLNYGTTARSFLSASELHTTACIAFKVGLPEQMFHVITNSNEALLTNPYHSSNPFRVLEKMYDFDEAMLFQITYVINGLLETRIKNGDITESFYSQLLESLITTQFKVNAEINSLIRTKWSTKVEIYSRLHWARDFIFDNHNRSITLADIAKEACLSIHHFKRLFKEVFHCTPHEYLTKVRMEKALSLIHTTKLNINEICKLVGFENASSFIRRFKFYYNHTPSRLRAEAPHQKAA